MTRTEEEIVLELEFEDVMFIGGEVEFVIIEDDEEEGGDKEKKQKF